MITSLAMAGLGVIDSAELELGPGLTVLTGETGAGKTMVVTSLELLLGARASADLVRTGAERARVTAHIELSEGHSVEQRVIDAGGEIDDHIVTAVRTVSANGRSRAALGGAAVPIGVLAQVGEDLVAVHGQHDQSALVAPARQRELLDRFGGQEPLAIEVAEGFRRLQSLKRELEQLTGERQERLREADSLRFALTEISAVQPQPGEDTELLTEEQRLAHAVDLKQAASEVAAGLSDDDRSVATQLAALERVLDAVRAHDPALEALAVRLAEVGYLVTDVASDLSAYRESVEADPGRLGEVQERRAALGALQRKYGPALDDVLQWVVNARERLGTVESTDDRLKALDDELELATAQWLASARTLSAERAVAAQGLSAQVTTELSALAMPDAELLVQVVPRHAAKSEPGTASEHIADSGTDDVLIVASPSGIDDIAFLLRPHRGAPPSPIHKGASGGELSRVMLAIEVVLADVDPVPTVVFDEVDAGVGGSAAVEVGRRLAQLGRSRQVLVVTHLPQVAAFADRHWAVRKSTAGEVTASGVEELDDAARVKELTRMLAGLADSTSGQAHAEELLLLAQEGR